MHVFVYSMSVAINESCLKFARGFEPAVPRIWGEHFKTVLFSIYPSKASKKLNLVMKYEIST